MKLKKTLAVGFVLAASFAFGGTADRLVNFALAYSLQVEAYQKVRACIRDKETKEEIQNCATHEDNMLHSRVDKVLKELAQ